MINLNNCKIANIELDEITKEQAEIIARQVDIEVIKDIVCLTTEKTKEGYYDK